MDIRPATLADVNVCLALDHSFFTNHVWQMKVNEADSNVAISFQTVRLPRKMQVEYPRALEHLVADWQREEGFFVAEVDGQVRGYVDVVLQPWLEAAWTANMAVHPDFRRRGIGTTLVRRARQWAKDRALQSLVMEMTTKNYPALSFCRKFGFEFCGFNDHYYSNQDIALFFVQTFR